MDGTLITAAAMNADLAEIQTKYNSGAVQTDVAKTITVQHTLTNGLLISGGTLDAHAVPVSTAALTASGLVTSATGLKSGSQAVAQFGTSDAAPVKITVSNTTNTSVDLQADEAGITHVDLTLQANGGTIGLGTKVTANAASGDSILPNAASVRGVNAAGTATKRLVGLNASNQVSIDADGVGTVFGAALPSPHMTSPVVDSGGIAVTGNSTITGNLNVTGSITGAAMGNVVAQPTDLVTTSATPGNSSLTVALGANQTWRLDLALGVACGSTGGVLLNFTVPTSAAGRLTYIGATNSATTLVDQTTTAITAGIGFVLYAGSGGVQMSLYIATAASAGSVTLQTSAGTAGQSCTLYAGSTMLATRIS